MKYDCTSCANAFGRGEPTVSCGLGYETKRRENPFDEFEECFGTYRVGYPVTGRDECPEFEIDEAFDEPDIDGLPDR